MTTVITTAAAATPRARVNRTPPLQWWRGECQPRLDAYAIAQLRTALDKIHLLHFPRWSAAVGGNAGAAVSVGLYVCGDATSPAWLVDLVGSLLLLCAAEGSYGAALVLRHLRRRHPSKRRTRKIEV